MNQSKLPIIGFLLFFPIACTANQNKLNEYTPSQTVIQFLRWYKSNKQQFNSLYPIDGNAGDAITYYKVNFKKLNIYLNKFKSSGLISDIFVYDIRQKYESANYLLKAHPQNDGPIDGLEADVIYQTFDEDDITKNLNTARVVKTRIKVNKAFVVVVIKKHYIYRAYLSRFNGHWVIDHLT